MAAKIRRLSAQGIIVAGSDKDVRKSAEQIGRYNTRQLQSQLEKVQRFNSRFTTFEAGRNGIPISKLAAGNMRIAEKLNNTRDANAYNRVKQTTLPTGMTIEGTDERIRGDKRWNVRVSKSRNGDWKPQKPRHVPIESYVSEKAIKQMTRSMLNRNTSQYLNKALKKQHTAAKEGIKRFGDERLSTMFGKLTQHQFNVLMNYTTAAHDIFARYREEVARSRGKSIVTTGNEQSEATEWVEWAAGLPKHP